MSDVARKLVTRPEWRWMPGMAWRSTRPGGAALSAQAGRVGDDGTAPEGAVPDLSDPATAGCLAVRLGEALHLAGLHGCWKLETTLPVGVWRVSRMGEGDLYGASLGEAVAPGLLAVWEAA